MTRAEPISCSAKVKMKSGIRQQLSHFNHVAFGEAGPFLVCYQANGIMLFKTFSGIASLYLQEGEITKPVPPSTAFRVNLPNGNSRTLFIENDTYFTGYDGKQYVKISVDSLNSVIIKCGANNGSR